MADLSVSGLASGFDWKSLVSQLADVERAPQAQLRREQSAIAQKGNGQYLLFNNTDAVAANISDQLNSMDQRNVLDNSLVNYKSYFQYFLGAAFLFLLIEIFIST